MYNSLLALQANLRRLFHHKEEHSLYVLRTVIKILLNVAFKKLNKKSETTITDKDVLVNYQSYVYLTSLFLPSIMIHHCLLWIYVLRRISHKHFDVEIGR